ncbi:MAG TPA: aromatic ring-hydroxylating dioxygenase subunit alpha [Tepidisphaeraceae bacterium]|nr:aromatic ring-hydroxylating dioxygenase subunit alpha [Tepidisphaeraceae bacterium]
MSAIKTTPLSVLHEKMLEAAGRPLSQATTFPPGAYTDPVHYEFEVDNILKREWLSVGHVSQIPKAGDYFNLDLLGEPMVVVRGKDMLVRVLSRVCPHRGMDVNPTEYGREAKGNARFLICPYHFWTYDLDGRCKGAPEMNKSENFNRKETGLPHFRSEIWNGLIFVTFAADIPPAAEVYGDMGKKLADWQLGNLEVMAEMEWDCAFNWKVIVENFAECYHHCGAHIKTFEPLFPAKTCYSDEEQPMYTVAHLPLIKELADDVRSDKSELKTFIDIPTVPVEKRVEWYVYVGYPTMLLFAAPDRVYWYRVVPDGPQRVKLLTTILAHPDARKMPHFEKALETDIQMLKDFHMEDMEACEAVQKGMNSATYRQGPLSYLEQPIWFIQRYLARKIREAYEQPVPAPDRGGAIAYSPQCAGDCHDEPVDARAYDVAAAHVRA